jgi:hypothetical protein
MRSCPLAIRATPPGLRVTPMWRVSLCCCAIAACGQSDQVKRVGSVEIVTRHVSPFWDWEHDQLETHIYCDGEHVSPVYGADSPHYHWVQSPSIGPTHVAFVDDVAKPSKLVLISSEDCTRLEPLTAPRVLYETVEWNTRGTRLSIAFEPTEDPDGISVALVSLGPPVSVEKRDGFLNAVWDSSGDSVVLVPYGTPAARANEPGCAGCVTIDFTSKPR